MIYIYYIWMMASAILSSYGIIVHWPSSSLSNEFLLFYDLAILIIFMPAFYILFFSTLLQVILYFNSHPKRVKMYMGSVYILNFVVLMIILGYKEYVISGIFIVFVASTIGLAHLFISVLLNPILKQKII